MKLRHHPTGLLVQEDEYCLASPAQSDGEGQCVIRMALLSGPMFERRLDHHLQRLCGKVLSLGDAPRCKFYTLPVQMANGIRKTVT